MAKGQQEGPPEGRRGRRGGRLRGYEKVVLLVGYAAIVYGIVRLLAYVAVLLAQ